jgi:hypothetical protein
VTPVGFCFLVVQIFNIKVKGDREYHFNHFPTLITERPVLRKIEDKDANDIFKLRYKS